MAISFECEGCGKQYTVRDELVGKTAQCKQCGHRMKIPSNPGLDVYGFEDAKPEPRSEETASSAMPPKRSAWATKPAGASSSENSRPRSSSPSKKERKSSFSFGGGETGGAIAAVFVVAMIGLRIYLKWEKIQARNAGNDAPPAQQAPPQVAFQNDVEEPRPAAADSNRGIAIPRFPEPGAAREIEPGVIFQEVVLGVPGQIAPGSTGKIWIYLPSGTHDPGSLPCVLIAPAGSNLLMGNNLGDAGENGAVIHPERIPYVKAGFAVVAYEIDGTVPDLEKASDQETMAAVRKFLRARAGIINAQIAFEYARTKIPSVDPTRISAVGHSSAGTLAVLLAENEPRLKACAVFAPALDLAKRFGPQAVAQFQGMGIGDVAGRYSPRNSENNLKCPMFLFHAQDDSNVPVIDSQEFARRAQANGKPVTLDIVPTGDHYDSMIDPGIAHAIAWLNSQGAGPNR